MPDFFKKKLTQKNIFTFLNNRFFSPKWGEKKSTEIKLFAVFLSLIGYLIYAFIFLKPFDYRSFSLIDDGQTLSNTTAIQDCFFHRDCSHTNSVFFEKQFGRFRPTYWIIQFGIQQIFGLNAQTTHAFRILLFGTTVVLLLDGIVLSMGGSFLAVLFAPAIFVTTSSFTENFVRIGPNDPYQLFVLALFSLLYLNFAKIEKRISPLFLGGILVFLLLCLFSIKETSIALLPVLFFIPPTLQRTKMRYRAALVGLPTLFLLLGRHFSKPNTQQTNYAQNYHLSVSAFIENSHSYLALLSHILGSLLPLFLIVWLIEVVVLKLKPHYDQRSFFYWVLIFCTFLSILLPWPYVLTRYLLVPLFVLAILGSVVFGEMIMYLSRFFSSTRLTRSWVFLFYPLTYAFVIPNLFFVSVSAQLMTTINYTSWYAKYLRFEHDEVHAVAAQKKVFLNAKMNLDNWEVTYEIPLHIHFFYRDSTIVRSLDSSIQSGDYLLSTTSLEPLIPEAELSKSFVLVSSQTYVVDQNNVPSFARDFHYQPIGAFQHPTSDTPIQHSWEMWRKL